MQYIDTNMYIPLCMYTHICMHSINPKQDRKGKTATPPKTEDKWRHKSALLTGTWNGNEKLQQKRSEERAESS